jgi:pilus assembly protein CpaF
MQEVFRFTPTGQEPGGKIRGHFEATGIVPRCTERLRLAGVELSPQLFERGRRAPRAA